MSSTPFQWNSSPAKLVMMISRGIVTTMPSLGKAMPKNVMAATMTMSGRQAMSPIGSPSSASIVRALKITTAPRIAMITLSSSGKKPGPGCAELPSE